jgi:GNAT superfamily N-acetyltransferase
MEFREAQAEDIRQMMEIRFAVKENVLNTPGLVTNEICEEFITIRGKGWVCDTGTEIAGFAIVDLQDTNIWALFVRPGYEGKGIGKRLHDDMVDWYFSQTDKTIWLGTSPNTRAEKFYEKAGWTSLGLRPNGEVKFELTAADWQYIRK